MAKDFFGSLGETLTKTAKELSGRADCGNDFGGTLYCAVPIMGISCPRSIIRGPPVPSIYSLVMTT